MAEQTPAAGSIRDVPPEVLAMADKTLLRIHELIDGAPLALVVHAYRAGLAAGRTDDIPGWVHEYGVSFDGDTLWLECDFCSTPVHGIDAGDSLETIVTKARDHRRTCVAEMGAVRG